MENLPPDSRLEHSRGPAYAPVSLLGYIDYECPYCAKSYRLLQRIEKQYPRQLRLTLRPFPLSEFHPDAERAALAAEAAGRQDRFWEMNASLFEHPALLSEADLVRRAKLLKLGLERFQTDLHDPVLRTRLDRQVARTLDEGIDETPTIIINGKKVEDWITMRALRQHIDEALASTERQRATG